MKPKLTTTLLIDISHDIHHGRPIWGILRINEYLTSNDPLRTALVTKASAIISSQPHYQALSDIIALIKNGTTLGELNEHMQTKLNEHGEKGTFQYKRYAFIPSKPKRIAQRRAALQNVMQG